MEKSIGQFALTGVIASISLLSGIVAILFKSEFQCIEQKEALAFIFLFPPLISIIVLYIISSHRQNIHRIGTYKQIFLEEMIFGEAWESRLHRFREEQQGEALDFIPWFFWIIFGASLLLSIIFISLYCNGYMKSRNSLFLFVLFIIEGFFIWKAHKEYRSHLDFREKSYHIWKKVSHNEKEL